MLIMLIIIMLIMLIIIMLTMLIIIMMMKVMITLTENNSRQSCHDVTISLGVSRDLIWHLKITAVKTQLKMAPKL